MISRSRAGSEGPSARARQSSAAAPSDRPKPRAAGPHQVDRPPGRVSPWGRLHGQRGGRADYLPRHDPARPPPGQHPTQHRPQQVGAAPRVWSDGKAGAQGPRRQGAARRGPPRGAAGPAGAQGVHRGAPLLGRKLGPGRHRQRVVTLLAPGLDHHPRRRHQGVGVPLLGPTGAEVLHLLGGEEGLDPAGHAFGPGAPAVWPGAEGLQGRAEIARAGEAPRRIPLQRPQDDALQLVGVAAGPGRRPRHRPRHALPPELHRVVVVKRRPTGRQPVEADPQLVEIHPEIRGGIQLLGRHEVQLPLDHSDFGDVGLVAPGRDAEVDEPSRTIGGHDDVAQADVAVHDGQRVAIVIGQPVGVVQPPGHIRHQPGEVPEVPEAAIAQAAAELGEVGASHIFHGHPGDAVLLAHLEDLADVGVVQARAQPGLVQEHLDKIAVIGPLGLQHLDQHELPEAPHAIQGAAEGPRHPTPAHWPVHRKATDTRRDGGGAAEHGIPGGGAANCQPPRPHSSTARGPPAVWRQQVTSFDRPVAIARRLKACDRMSRKCQRTGCHRRIREGARCRCSRVAGCHRTPPAARICVYIRGPLRYTGTRSTG